MLGHRVLYSQGFYARLSHHSFTAHHGIAGYCTPMLPLKHRKLNTRQALPESEDTAGFALVEPGVSRTQSSQSLGTQTSCAGKARRRACWWLAWLQSQFQLQRLFEKRSKMFLGS